MCCCYRDTKMEIQGLTDAQNTHYQHGASRRTASSPLGLKVGRRLGSVSNENEIGDRTGLHEFQNDCNNNRPRTSRLRLLAENGSDACLAVYSRQGRSDPQTGTVELCNVNVTKEKGYSELELPADFVRGGLKYSDENVDNVLQMALPLFEAEDGYAGHTQRQPPRALRHQPQDGATQHQPLLSETTAASGSHPREASAARDSEEFYVVFNIVQENGRAAKERPVLSKGEEEVSAKRAVTLKPRTFSAMEVHGASALAGSDENLADLATSKTSSFSSFINSFSSSDQISEPDSLASVSERQEMCFEGDNSSIVLSNDIGGACSQQLATEMMAASCPVLLEQAPCEMAQHEARNSTALITEKTDASEVVDMTDAGNNVEYAPDLVSIPATGNGDRASEATPASAHETFSGTIMINNQSIIVTIENGVLTLAAPPEGYGYKEDGMVSLKEHLGMKDHEDIVLLNYDSGTKSIGKISNVASAQDEPKAGLSVSDSELTLADDCSLAGLSATLDSCAPVKQEDGAPCSVADGDPAAHGSRCAPMVCEDDLPAMGLVSAGGLAKKGALVTYRCPQPGCPNTFDTRQKLKMHLVFHTEDQRPFKCSVESCGWSFTTAYKLKRHLQSHDKVRPYACEWESCGRRFTTVYNLKAHVKAHEQEDAFACETCGERFRSATRLANHQRAHFEPERPHKCEFPGCEKTFITFSALFSHNRAHFRDTVQFTCTYPGCDKRYNKACRLKIHLRSHTGERPFVCDSEACGWTFTSMSKLLRHKRKHDDDRRFICQEKGCGKSFTRAEHLKGHSITHLGTKPFECPVEGCSAKFSARSSLYIHSKKHRQDGVTLRSRCPVAGCTKHFSSRSSLKSHMLKHHNLSADVLSQLETATSLTPSSELTSAIQSGPGASGPVGADLSSLDLSSLFSGVAPGAPATVAAGGAVGGSGPASFAMDMSLVSSGILTIDPASVGSALAGSKAMDPLILAAGADMGPHVLDAGLGAAGGVGVLPPATTLNLDDVQTVSAEALGSLTALALQGAVATSTATAVPGDQLQALSSSSALAAEPPAASLTATLAASAVLVPSPLGGAAAPGPGPVAELLSPQPKTDSAGPRGRSPGGPLLAGVEAALGQTEAGGKGLSRFVFPPHASAATAYGRTKDQELGSTTPGSFLESGGSARTDYRAIQLAKRRKQRGPGPTAGAGQRKSKGAKGSSSAVPLAPASARFGDGSASANGGLTIRDPVTGAQYVQIQLLQDDPATDGDLAFQLSSQTSSSHSQLTVDLPVNILQEPAAMAEDDNGSESSQFTGSTINLQDLE